jgi:pyrroline-5-carboxylate reductase
MKFKIGFIGAGAMAEALIRGLIKAGAVPENVIVSDIQRERLTTIRKLYGIRIAENNQEVFENADVVVVAVKPQNVTEALSDLTEIGKGIHLEAKPLVVSIAAGIPLNFLENLLPPMLPVIRVMPNTPSMIGYGATAICLGKTARPEHEVQARSIFEAVGIVFTVPESQMDAVTGLSGSGPAYGYIIIEALADAGVRAGLPRTIALGLAAQTLAGAAQMVLDTGLHPGVLKDQVTSPGGTTIAGVHALELGGLRGTLMNAVMAATLRSQELRR